MALMVCLVTLHNSANLPCERLFFLDIPLFYFPFLAPLRSWLVKELLHHNIKVGQIRYQTDFTPNYFISSCHIVLCYLLCSEPKYFSFKKLYTLETPLNF